MSQGDAGSLPPSRGVSQTPPIIIELSKEQMPPRIARLIQESAPVTPQLIPLRFSVGRQIPGAKRVHRVATGQKPDESAQRHSVVAITSAINEGDQELFAALQELLNGLPQDDLSELAHTAAYCGQKEMLEVILQQPGVSLDTVRQSRAGLLNTLGLMAQPSVALGDSVAVAKMLIGNNWELLLREIPGSAATYAGACRDSCLRVRSRLEALCPNKQEGVWRRSNLGNCAKWLQEAEDSGDPKQIISAAKGALDVLQASMRALRPLAQVDRMMHLKSADQHEIMEMIEQVPSEIRDYRAFAERAAQNGMIELYDLLTEKMQKLGLEPLSEDLHLPGVERGPVATASPRPPVKVMQDAAHRLTLDLELLEELAPEAPAARQSKIKQFMKKILNKLKAVFAGSQRENQQQLQTPTAPASASALARQLSQSSLSGVERELWQQMSQMVVDADAMVAQVMDEVPAAVSEMATRKRDTQIDINNYITANGGQVHPKLDRAVITAAVLLNDRTNASDTLQNLDDAIAEAIGYLDDLSRDGQQNSAEIKQLKGQIHRLALFLGPNWTGEEARRALWEFGPQEEPPPLPPYEPETESVIQTQPAAEPDLPSLASFDVTRESSKQQIQDFFQAICNHAEVEYDQAYERRVESAKAFKMAPPPKEPFPMLSQPVLERFADLTHQLCQAVTAGDKQSVVAARRALTDHYLQNFDTRLGQDLFTRALGCTEVELWEELHAQGGGRSVSEATAGERIKNLFRAGANRPRLGRIQEGLFEKGSARLKEWVRKGEASTTLKNRPTQAWCEKNGVQYKETGTYKGKDRKKIRAALDDKDPGIKKSVTVKVAPPEKEVQEMAAQIRSEWAHVRELARALKDNPDMLDTDPAFQWMMEKVMYYTPDRIAQWKEVFRKMDPAIIDADLEVPPGCPHGINSPEDADFRKLMLAQGEVLSALGSIGEEVMHGNQELTL